MVQSRCRPGNTHFTCRGHFTNPKRKRGLDLPSLARLMLRFTDEFSGVSTVTTDAMLVAVANASGSERRAQS